ncbi:aminopeptidase [Candidatus Atribacteria bacterium HGW-Atribacteria-1]|nr:MAG: aminopeptidase [Candidatus Atribacteria bacterium HGW-Atribacteria-1]
MDNRIKKHAEVLLKYSLDLKKGEKIIIVGDVVTLPLIKESYRLAVELGALPQVMINSEELKEILLKGGSGEQIKYVPVSVKKAFETVDVLLSLFGEPNTRMFSNVNPEKMKLSAQGSSEITKIFFERVAKKELRWCGTMFPNQANAQEANMSISEYEDFVYGAGYIGSKDPIVEWKEIEKKQEGICNILNGKEHLRIVSKDTDLKMSIEGRKWVNCCGRVNFPDGEVFTGPVEDSVEGHIRFSFPGIYGGREIEDIQLTFERGKVIKVTAAKGQELLEQLLETDKGARYVGEIAAGTNYNIKKFTKHMLFDEKIGGTVHLAIGRSIPESLGKNQSAIHWDMLCDMKKGGEIYADGELVYKDGKFLI